VRAALREVTIVHPAADRPGWPCRVRRDELPLGVRRVGGGAYQARPWVGGSLGNVNLGIFHPDDYEGDRGAAIEAAGRAVREFLKRVAGPPVRDVWDVVKELMRVVRFGRPIVSPEVLPPGIVRTKDGRYAVERRDRYVRISEMVD
jgi:hypothetical protein